MNGKKSWYMAVELEPFHDGFNVQVWISPDPIFAIDMTWRKYTYKHETTDCEWRIASDTELTPKLLGMVTEYADRICAEQTKINARRKLANR